MALNSTPPLNKLPSHREIAALAGVSKAAVSLALKHAPKISAATHDRIWKIANELGYKEDAHTASYMSYIRRGRPNNEIPVIGLLTAFRTEREWLHNAHFKRFHETVLARATAQGYRIDEIWITQPGMNRARLTQILSTRNIQGLIIAPSGAKAQPLPLDLEHYALAECTDHGWKPQLHRAAPNHYFNMSIALESLEAKGYVRPGVACIGEDFLIKGHEHEGAYEFWSRRHGDANRVPPYVNHEYTFDGFRQWVENYRPDVVISNYQAVPKELSEYGVKVPETIGFCLMGIIDEFKHFSGINCKYAAIDAATVDLVVAQLNRGERGIPTSPRNVTFEGEWHEGQSTPGPISKKSSHTLARARSKKKPA